jgi:hypothetical protein
LRKRIVDITKPDLVVFRRNLEKFEGIRQALQCYKHSLMGNSVGNSEEQNADRNMDNKDSAHEVSDGNQDSIRNWTGDRVCYTVAKHVSTFSPYPNTL